MVECVQHILWMRGCCRGRRGRGKAGRSYSKTYVGIVNMEDMSMHCMWSPMCERRKYLQESHRSADAHGRADDDAVRGRRPDVQGSMRLDDGKKSGDYIIIMMNVWLNSIVQDEWDAHGEDACRVARRSPVSAFHADDGTGSGKFKQHRVDFFDRLPCTHNIERDDFIALQDRLVDGSRWDFRAVVGRGKGSQELVTAAVILR